MKLRKLLFILVSVLLLCGLTGCGGESGDPTGNSGSTENPGNTGVTGVVNADQNWAWADFYEGAFSDQGYYYLHNDSFLYFLDTTSGVVTALCAEAGCLHAEEPNNRQWENCGAYMAWCSGRLTPMCFWNGNLFCVGMDMSLYRSNATGIERLVMGTLGSVYTKELKTVSSMEHALSGSLWYYHGTVDSIVRDPETGRGLYQQELEYISRVDLATGKEEILIEDRENNLTLCAANNNGVLFIAEKCVDLNDPNYMELLNNRTAALKYWDSTTGEVTTLFQKVSTAVDMVMGAEVFCRTFAGGKVSSFTLNLNKGEEKTVFPGASIKHLGGGYGLRLVNGNSDGYLYNLQTGDRLPNELSGGIWMKCAADRGCILREHATGTTSYYYYVPYAAFADGLQKEDAMSFYTR